MEIEDDEILQGFIEESLEHLADIESDLLAIEAGGANIDSELVNKVFRAAHSIKGGAGFMGLVRIQELSHAMENVLGMIRSNKLIPTSEIVNVLLQGSDRLQQMIENVQESNDTDISSLLTPLNAIADGTFTATQETVEAEAPPSPTADEPTTPEPVAETPIPEEPEPEPEPVQQEEESPPEEPEAESSTAEDEDTDSAAEVHEAHAEAAAPVPVTNNHPQTADANTPAKTKAQGDTTLRVHVSLLDQLMTLAGELVLSRNQLLQTIGSEDFRNAETVGQRIDLITSELQEAIMLTRMQPIGNVFNKFPRVVRDLSGKLKKKIDLSIVGKDVELDKTIIESINDPLTHLVRNAVDHGIETPDVRKKAGKSPTGHVVLKAYHEAGQVVIEIADDGRGLDGDGLATSAMNKGLITAEQAQIMSEKEKVNLIFLPGFSTAKKVTDVSGRGVGMDVVKTNLDKLGGSVDIISELGKGTTISIKLPLTLAIIPCQIIVTGGERYAIPQVNLEELLRIPASQIKERIERVGNADVVRLRGNLLPLIRLADVIGINRTYTDPRDNTEKEDQRQSISDRRGKKFEPFYEDDSLEVLSEHPDIPPESRKSVESQDRRYASTSALNIVVVSTGAMKYGLIVDRLQDSEEIVIKPLGIHLQQCKGYAGATIMGDGRIALILDVSNLARMANLTSVDGSDRASEIAIAQDEHNRAQKDKQSLLIFKSSESERFAVPLNQVERIEKIKRADIEELAGKRVMQYRGGSLTLVSIDDVASVQPLADNEDLLVIVFNIKNRPVGLLATGPIDAIEIQAEFDDTTLRQPGIMGSVILEKHTTMLVDVFEIVQTVFPEWFEDQIVYEPTGEEEGRTPTILVAEDSNFFRNQVKGYLQEVGYDVIEAEDGAIAWDILQERSEEITLILTDIEMPNLNGFELTQKIRSHPSYSAFPVIALTTLAGEEDVAKGKAVGINEYHIKLDKERLMACVHDYVKRYH